MAGQRSNTIEALAATILAIGAVALAFLARPATNHFQTGGVFDQGGIAFDYPANWVLHDKMPATTGMGQTIALLGTLPWGPCTDYDVNCHHEQRLGPGQIEIELGRGPQFSEGGFCAFAQQRPDLEGRGPDDPQVVQTRFLRIDGRPGIYTEFAVGGKDYYLSDQWRHWIFPETNATQAGVYWIRAKFRDPGGSELGAALDRLIESVKVGIPYSVSVPPQGDCGEPFPPA